MFQGLSFGKIGQPPITGLPAKGAARRPTEAYAPAGRGSGRSARVS